ncbi:MAG: hypothetical protein JWN49_499 [Parcubacteria group bacterium]|nr:hypothetical protein [Parcubacteria group bacterium]
MYACYIFFMKDLIDVFAFTAPGLAIGGAVVDFLLFFSMAIVQDSPTMDPAFQSMINHLSRGASTAFWLATGALVLLLITHWFIKKPSIAYVSHALSAGIGLIGIVVAIIPLVPVVVLFVKG